MNDDEFKRKVKMVRKCIYTAETKYNLEFSVVIVACEQSMEAIIHSGQWNYTVTADEYNGEPTHPIALDVEGAELSANALAALFEAASKEYWRVKDKH